MTNEQIRIPVIDNQTGQAGSLPAEQVDLHDADFVKRFSLAPSSPLQPIDFSKDGRINVLSKDGTPGTLPVDQALDAIKPVSAGGGGYQLQSQFERSQDPLVKRNIDLLSAPLPTIGVGMPERYKELNVFHQNDDVVDPQGNFKMIKDGHELAVPSTQLDQARSAGYKFKDDNFQALLDAQLHLQGSPSEHDINWGNEAFHQALRSNAENLPLIGTALKASDAYVMANPKLSNLERARMIASRSSELQQAYHEPISVGKGAALAEQLLAPEGIIGEGLLATKAGSLIKGAEILEGSPIIASVVSNAVKGIAYTAPQTADALINKNPKLAAESVGLGALGGIVFGGLPELINKVISSRAARAGEALPGAIDKGLSSLGAEGDLLQVGQQTKQKLLDTLTEAGLKESSSAENTLKVLSKVSAGDHINVLPSLDKVAEEKILTGHLSSDLMTMVHGPNGAAEVSPELESAVTSLNQKIDKLFPEGVGTMEQVQKLASDLSSKITKAGGEVNNFNIQAKDLIMSEVFKAGDQAIMNADPKLVNAWAEQKAIAQSANQMYGVFGSQLANAERLAAKEGVVSGNSLLKDLSLATAAKIPGAKLANRLAGGDRLPSFTDVAFEHGRDFIKGLLSNSDSAGKNWLIKNADNPNIGSYLAINAIHGSTSKLEQIPEFLRNPAIKTLIFAGTDNPIKDILGSDANGLSKQQQFDKLSNKVSMLASNQQARDQYLNMVTSVLTKNHPELAASVKSELTNKIMATNDLLHAGNQTVPQAFQKQQKFSPSKEQMSQIEAGLNAIENPYSILSGLKNGRVTQNQVDLVKQTHPAIYQEMVNQINKEAYSGKTSLTYQQRISASIITGQPLDASLKNGAALQATYIPAAAPPAQSKHSKRNGNSHSIKPETVAGYTTAQRLSGGK